MSPHAAESLRSILVCIMGDNPDGKVWMAEDAPPALIVNIHRALDLSAEKPLIDPAAKETP